MSTAVDLRKQRLIWIDLEMTGLDPEADQILEIATIVTDVELNELAQGPVFAIGTSVERLEAMDAWNRNTHKQSGLWQRALDEGVSLAEAERQTLAFLETWCEAKSSPMCGNSICQDRRFLARGMPSLERFFHYRHLDVSTLKELARRWAPQVSASLKKLGKHEALADIRESVEELKHYRQFMGELGGNRS
jgi:oligoribonuclease